MPRSSLWIKHGGRSGWPMGFELLIRERRSDTNLFEKHSLDLFAELLQSTQVFSTELQKYLFREEH